MCFGALRSFFMYQVSREPFLVGSYGAILFWQEHRGNLSGKQADVSNYLFFAELHVGKVQRT